jgi:hypothetical protein
LKTKLLVALDVIEAELAPLSESIVGEATERVSKRKKRSLPKLLKKGDLRKTGGR